MVLRKIYIKRAEDICSQSDLQLEQAASFWANKRNIGCKELSQIQNGEVKEMKKIIAAAVALVAVIALIVAIPKTQSNSDFLRIHIRADSNGAEDQNVKYVVKAAVVEYLTPYLSKADTKQKAMAAVSSQLENVKKVCDKTLAANGKNYRATVKLCQEEFPDRAYNGYTLKAGVYDALIIELGSGSGNNWWCVVYPPLCFVEGTPNGGNGIVFKSKLLEIIEKWKTEH